MKIVGLTGNIFSGKTTTAKLFKAKGAIIIDADKIAHAVLKNNKRYIDGFFGKHLTRAQIAQIVFKDKNKLNKLCDLLHPEIIFKIKKKILEIKSKSPDKVVIVDAALLIESGLYKDMDRNIVVVCSKGAIIKRAQKEGMTKEQALLRLKCQLSEDKKIKYADFIIKNNRGEAELKKQVEKVCKKLR